MPFRSSYPAAEYELGQKKILSNHWKQYNFRLLGPGNKSCKHQNSAPKDSVSHVWISIGKLYAHDFMRQQNHIKLMVMESSSFKIQFSEYQHTSEYFSRTYAQTQHFTARYPQPINPSCSMAQNLCYIGIKSFVNKFRTYNKSKLIIFTFFLVYSIPDTIPILQSYLVVINLPVTYMCFHSLHCTYMGFNMYLVETLAQAISALVTSLFVTYLYFIFQFFFLINCCNFLSTF